MGLSVENLVVAVVLVLPGFLSAAIRTRYQPGSDAMSVSWLGMCLLRSLAFNLILVLAFSRVEPDILKVSLLTAAKDATLPSDVGRDTLLVYCGLLYVVAYLWGHAPVVPLLRGLQANLRAGGTIDPDTSVFRQTLEVLLRRPRRHGVLTTLANALQRAWDWLKALLPAGPRQSFSRTWAEIAGVVGPLREANPEQGIWLLVRRGDGRRLLGKIAKTSSKIDASGPFETLLYPAAEIDQRGHIVVPSIDPNAKGTGFYFRVQPDDEVFFYRTDPEWRPPQMAQTEVQPDTVSVPHPPAD